MMQLVHLLILFISYSIPAVGLGGSKVATSLSADGTPVQFAKGNQEGISSITVQSNGALYSEQPHSLMRRQTSIPGGKRALEVDAPSAAFVETSVPTEDSVDHAMPSEAAKAPTAAKASFVEVGRGSAESGGGPLAVKHRKAKQANPKCNPAKETCCNPEDPPAVFEACKQQQMEEGDGLVDRLIPCDKTCANNCCCFFAFCVKTLIRTYVAAKAWLVKSLMKVAAFSASMSSGVFELKVSNQEPPDAKKDPEEEKLFAIDTAADILKWWIGAMCISYLICRLHEFLTELKICSKRSQGEEEVPDNDPGNVERALKFLTPVEQDRLGGVVKALTVQIKSINRNKWHIAVFFSLGMFYWICKIPEQACVMVLGKSGRFLILTKKPLTPMSKAYRIFISAGITLLCGFTIFLVWLRSVERAMVQAAKSPDPTIRNAAKANPTKEKIIGQVHVYALAAFIVLWLVQSAILSFSLRTWASDTGSDYYESEEVSSAQYFRGGKRGMIPCCSKRRRTGGLRMFFGPYPQLDVWKNIAQGFEGKFLNSLEPMAQLPVETDQGSPGGGGGGSPPSEDQKAGKWQAVLGGAQWFLGTLGMTVFIIHMINLGQNIELCPNSTAIQSCILQNDCTRFVQSGWFQMFMERSGFMTPDMVQEAALSGDIKLAHIGMWMKLKDMKETEDAAVLIAEKACMDRREELIDGPMAASKPVSADTLGKFNAENYLATRSSLGIDIAWDNVKLECRMCAKATVVHYLSNFENVAELTEVFILMLTCYVSAMLIKMSMRKLSNSPIGDLTFETDPSTGSGGDQSIDEIEKASLSMMSQVFFHRYSGGNIPDEVKTLENKIRFAKARGMDESKFPDPFKFDETAAVWSDYNILSGTRMFVINKNLLGICDGEEVVSAWSEVPRLTTMQKVVLFSGIFFLLICPCVYGIAIGVPKCLAEGLVAGGTHLALFKYFVLNRRIQAGFVLTTRRLFQISRTPNYRDVFGKVEPLLKIDVIVHNSSIFYLSGMFEGTVPLMRRIMAKCCGSPIYRSGGIVFQSYEGIAKFWRDKGDCRESIEALSKCVYAEDCRFLRPATGNRMMELEKQSPENLSKDPCMPWILCCCPYTAPPQYAEPDLIKRYAMRFPTEQNIYGRMLTTRPAGCKDLCCGKGCCRCALECCPCCMFDETLSDFMVTTHRVLVEQRVSMRYCRCCFCVRPAPNIRVTFLSNHRASSYVLHKTGTAQGISKLRQDMCIKLLPTNAREFPAGLMLRQQPYRIVSNAQDDEDLMWTKHLTKIYDALTEKEGGKDLVQSESEDSEDGDGLGAEGYGEDASEDEDDAGSPKAAARPKGASRPKGAARPKGSARS